MRRYRERSSDAGPLPSRPFCPGCIISTRGYDFREGQVAVIAERLATLYARQYRLVLFEPPIKLPDFTISVLTNVGREGDPALDWLRQQVVEVCKSIA